MYAIKWDESTPKVMNCLSQEKDTLRNFRNLLQFWNYQEARSLLVCKQEAFQILSKRFVRSMNLMQQLPEDVFAMCLVPEAKQLCQLNGALIWASILVLTVTAFLHLVTIFSLIVAKRRLGSFFNFEPCRWKKLIKCYSLLRVKGLKKLEIKA